MQTEYYKESLQDALKNLIEVNRSIFNSLIPIALTGELSEWNKSVPVGEVHKFDVELLEGCEDTNIRLLFEILEKVDDIYETIKNINSL